MDFSRRCIWGQPHSYFRGWAVQLNVISQHPNKRNLQTNCRRLPLKESGFLPPLWCLDGLRAWVIFSRWNACAARLETAVETKREQEKPFANSHTEESHFAVWFCRCHFLRAGLSCCTFEFCHLGSVAGNKRAKCCVIVGVAPALFHYLSS